jgi:hypothetical protein
LIFGNWFLHFLFVFVKVTKMVIDNNNNNKKKRIKSWVLIIYQKDASIQGHHVDE